MSATAAAPPAPAPGVDRTGTGRAPQLPYGPRGVETGLVRQALPFALVIAPVALLVGWFADGSDGLVSAGIGLVLAVSNLVVAAVVLERAARVGPHVLMGAAMGSFVVRLLLLTFAFVALRELPFVNFVVLGLVLAFTHLGVLIGEAAVVTRGDMLASPKIVTPSPIDSDRSVGEAPAGTSNDLSSGPPSDVETDLSSHHKRERE